MRTLITAATLIGGFVLVPSGVAQAVPDDLAAAACSASNGQFTTYGGITSCVTTTTREVLGPVTALVDRRAYNSTMPGQETRITGESQRVTVVEVATRTVQAASGGEPVSFSNERGVSSAIRPLACKRYVQRGTSMPIFDTLPLEVCGELRLFSAPLAVVPLARSVPDPAAFVRTSFEQMCAALDGSFTATSGGGTCSFTSQQQVPAPVTTRQVTEVADYANPNIYQTQTWTSASQQVDITETITTLARRGNDVTTAVTERPVSSSLQPLTCHSSLGRSSYHNFTSESTYVDLDVCQSKGLLPA